MLWAAPLGSSAEWAEPTNVDPARSTVAAERRIFRIEYSCWLSDKHSPREWTAVSSKVAVLPSAVGKWSPLVTSTRRAMTYSADLPDDRDQSSTCCVQSSTGLISAAWTYSPKCSIGFVS